MTQITREEYDAWLNQKCTHLLCELLSVEVKNCISDLLSSSDPYRSERIKGKIDILQQLLNERGLGSSLMNILD